MTERLVDDWLAHRAYFRLSLQLPQEGGGEADPMRQSADNPDQRIAEDVRDFVDNTLSIGLGQTP